MHLYELSAEMHNLLEQVTGIAETQLSDDELKIRLDLFAGQFEYKAVEIGKMIYNLRNDVCSILVEEDRLKQKRKSLENKQDWLEKYLQMNMKETGLVSIRGDVLTLSLRDNPPSVKVVDLMELPVQFTRIIPEMREPDKKAILAHFKETGEIPTGCEIVRGQRLEIK